MVGGWGDEEEGAFGEGEDGGGCGGGGGGGGGGGFEGEDGEFEGEVVEEVVGDWGGGRAP